MTAHNIHASTRRLRPIAIAALCAWAAAILVVLFYAVSWRYATVFMPRASAGVISLVLVVGSAASALLSGIWRFFRGPRPRLTACRTKTSGLR